MCGFHQPHDARQRGFGAGSGDPYLQQSIQIDGTASNSCARFAQHRCAFAGEQGFIQLAAAFSDDAIGRHAFARADDEHITNLQAGDGNRGFGAVAQHGGMFRTQGLQRTYGRSGLHASARFQPLAEQYQGDDDGGCFEIQIVHAAAAVQQLEQRETEGSEGAERHQGVHVGGAALECLEAAQQEAAAEPELHRCRQRQLQPAVQHEMHTHPLQQHRRYQGQRECSRQQELQLLGVSAPSSNRLFCSGSHTGVITGVLHCCFQRFGLQVVAAHSSGFQREVDAGFNHARHFLQRSFDVRHTGGTRHAFDFERQCVGCRDVGCRCRNG